MLAHERPDAQASACYYASPRAFRATPVAAGSERAAAVPAALLRLERAAVAPAWESMCVGPA